ncbi:MAG: ABC transporter ATP-binding protein/permease [Thermoflavifilum sp.]|nr:ABC transporter ATP-binding protein/permease [Thermoflavifilum sp.]
MKNLFWVFRYLKKHIQGIVLYFLFNLLAIVFSLVSLTMLIPFLSLIFGKTQPVHIKPAFHLSSSGLIELFNYYLTQVIDAYGKSYAIGVICLVVIVAILLKNLFTYAATFISTPIRNGILMDIRRDLFNHVIALPIGYFSEEKKADILSRMTNDVQEIEVSIISFLESAFRDPFTVLIYFFTLLVLSPQLTLFLVVLLPLAGLIIGRISKSLKRHSNAGQERLSNLLSIMDETITGLRILKAFNAERQQQLRFQQENHQLFRIKNRINWRRDLASPLSEFLGVVVLCVVLFFGGRLALSSPPVVSADVFIAYIAIFSQIINPLKSFSTTSYNIQKGRASAERIQQILSAPIYVTEKPNALPIDRFEHAIEFRNVSFRYRDQWVLQQVSLKIEKGKTIAIVGASGAGKSTLVDLIPRFHDVTEGEILIDGINIKEYRLYDLRKLMGIVTQEPILFNDTIANNIALGANREVTPEEIVAAARVANAHTFIMQKEQGYETNVGDRGIKLSGGEKQRITIARAVLKNPPILILDEATSSLDTESERLVQEAIQRLMKNRTSIIVAHRLSTIQHADEIYVLSNGRVVEHGSHEELMALNGTYRRLIRMQQISIPAS